MNDQQPEGGETESGESSAMPHGRQAGRPGERMVLSADVYDIGEEVITARAWHDSYDTADRAAPDATRMIIDEMDARLAVARKECRHRS